MKLQKKMLLIAAGLIVVPIILLTAALAVLERIQSREIQKNYEVEEEDVDVLGFNAVSRFEALMNSLEKGVQAADPEALAQNGPALEELNKSMTVRGAYLLALMDGEYYYNGAGDNETIRSYLLENLPIENGEKLYFSVGKTHYLIGCSSFVTAAGREGTVCLVCDVSSSDSELGKSISTFLIFTILVLIMTGSLTASLLQSNLFQPLRKLQKATNAIKEGNLDYELQVEGNDEIADLCRDFEDMRRRLKDTAAEQLQYEQDNKILISNISHDLKTPITAIKGYVEGIQDGVASSPEKLDKYIRTIYNKANDMDRLVDELTLYSRIDTNRIPYNFAKISVREYFGDCAEELQDELNAQGIELEYRSSLERDVEIIGDPEQLNRVINNIISNSVKYMDKAKGIINIRVSESEGFVRVEIEDNGKGIATKDVPYIFDRFYRTDSSRNSRTGGSGIGLSIVKKIIEDHGGRIWATSKEGFGTTMIFELRKYEGVNYE